MIVLHISVFHKVGGMLTVSKINNTHK